MRFADIIGQDDIKRHLISTVKENRISHAQMFLGREGYGSLPLAIAYAQYINCQNRTDADSCGECPSCRQISKLSFPDLHFAFPVPATGSSKEKAISDTYFQKWAEFIKQNPYGNYQQWLDFVEAGNSQGSIRVDESNEIIRKLTMKTFTAEYKIMIIWLPEKMNTDASNKLLKLIEEPYPKTLFLLVAENSENIISTIISRTQLVKVPRITDTDICTGLQSKGVDAVEAEKISKISEGNFGTALEYCGHTADLANNFELFVKLMRTSYAFKAADMVALAEELGSLGREKQKALLSYCERMVRENLIMNRNLGKLTHFTDDEGGFAQKFSRFIHPQNSGIIAETLDKAYYHISRNASAKIVFLDTIITLARSLRIPAA
ncbi:MAG: DNA polymerase III subunit delta [Salinivirgaceae bacterium]|nr:DNA polymerase III subunit delta [Salinivirgaceae bacterium]